MGERLNRIERKVNMSENNYFLINTVKINTFFTVLISKLRTGTNELDKKNKRVARLSKHDFLYRRNMSIRYHPS